MRIAIPLRLFYLVAYPLLVMMNSFSCWRCGGWESATPREMRRSEEELGMVLTESSHHGY